jgi:hypothetical protein
LGTTTPHPMPPTASASTSSQDESDDYAPPPTASSYTLSAGCSSPSLRSSEDLPRNALAHTCLCGQLRGGLVCLDEVFQSMFACVAQWFGQNTNPPRQQCSVCFDISSRNCGTKCNYALNKAHESPSIPVRRFTSQSLATPATDPSRKCG